MDGLIVKLLQKHAWLNSLLPVLTFLWIWMLTTMILIRGTGFKGADVSIIKIIFVTLALVCIVTFQFSRDLWQEFIVQFWIVVILYSTFVFFLLFIFQFGIFRTVIRNVGVTTEWQQDIGLYVFELEEFIIFVFSNLFIIITTFILIVLLRKTDPVITIQSEFVAKMVEVLDTFFDITKLTIFVIIMSCITTVNAVNFFILLGAVFSMVLRRTFRFVVIKLISLSAAAILFMKMTFQLQHFKDLKNIACMSGNVTVLLNKGDWLGISKIKSNESVFQNTAGYICIIIFVTVYTVVIKEDNVIQGLQQNTGWDPDKMFHDITYMEADKDISSYIKYILKYGFYRYGIEFTYICIALLIQARLDVWALLSSLWLLILIMCSREWLPFVWHLYKYFILVSIPLQYAAALGFWLESCFGFEVESDDTLRNAFLWLHLPIGNTKPDSYKLFWDALVFLFVLCQVNVFEYEKRSGQHEALQKSPDIFGLLNAEQVRNSKSTFGQLRYVIFCSLPIISAIAFFIAATTSITIFSIGYGIGFSLILWFADNYFLRSSNQTIILWKYLLMFSVIMIFVKTCLQIPACIFMDSLIQNSCWIVQLLGITCLRISTTTIAFLKVPIWSASELSENSCWYHPASVGLEWDVFCFISLMFHRRFLQSNYFDEMAKQANLNAKFSNKAAKILEELNEKKIRDSRQKYAKNLEKIQKNMNRLKEAQKRTWGIKIAEPGTHQEAVTSGDYYMFYDGDKREKLSDDLEEQQKPKEDPESPQTPSVGKFMETVLQKDIEQALRLADSSSTESDKSSSSYPTQKKKCYKCECTTKEAADLNMEIKLKQREVELEQNEETVSASDTIMNGVKKPEIKKRSLSIVLKDEKLQPSITTEHTKEATNRVPAICFQKQCCMSSLSQIFNELAYEYKHIKKELEKETLAYELKKSPKESLKQIQRLKSEGIENQFYQRSIYMKLLLSMHDAIMSNFSTVCFLSVLLLQMQNSSLLCLPLTMMVLFWGSLSIPRPTKRFWKIIITYTASLLLMECVFRSQLIQYDQRIMNSKIFQINQLFGIDRDEDNSIYYLIVILAVFLQRRLLVNIGLWPIEPPLQRGRNLFSTGFVSVKNFFQKLLYESYNRMPVDVYTHIFVCDFINIFVFIFGFASITEKQEDGVSRYFFENRIPPALLVIFIIQCLMIFIDRWIYLRRHVTAKLIFQFIQIIAIHFCLFLLLPAATFRRFNQWFFPSLWYSIKCVYLLLSAYQIRCGYPPSVHGHALCQSYNVINMYLYQFYLIIPFVYELRTVTDWMWTETTLTLSEWIGMEDIFCTVFLLKCWRNYDNKYSYRRGQKITSTVKLSVGGGVVLLFFLLLLFPLAFFAFGRVAGQMNIPQEMELKFRIGSYQPIYEVFTFDIVSLNVSQWLRFKDLYKFYPRATTFLSEYYPEDVGVVRFPNHSMSAWSYSPAFNNTLISNLESAEPVKMVAEWTLQRKTENTRQSNLVHGFHRVTLSTKSRQELLELLRGSRDKFSIENLSPKFLKVSSVSTSYSVDALMISYDDSQIPSYANVTFQLDRSGNEIWWKAYVYYLNARNLLRAVDSVVSRNNEEIIIFTFNEKIFPPGIFSYFSAQGIIGLYTTFLISLGLIIRRLCRGRTNQVFLDYLPNVDSILQLLLDIYFVREHKDGKLEEDLYAKLIFLFRSPETLIRWTRMPEESD